MAYDPATGDVVLFGGYDPSVQADRDTWLFVNNSWTDITANLSVSPPARWGSTMVWDPVSKSLVLFGGRNVTAFLNDTWSFNGTVWTPVSASVAPSPRSLFQMAYDPVDGEILLQGGIWGNLSATTTTWKNHDDIWSYRNGTWTNITGSYRPVVGDRALGQAAYDPWNRSVVLVGGVSASSPYGCLPADPIQTLASNRSYTYPAPTGPGNLSEEMMTYDPTGPYLFLFGGYGPTASGGCAQLNSTWVRAGGTWVNISASLATAPSVRYLAGIAFDAQTDQVVLFGGNSGGTYLNDTWTFTVPALNGSLTAGRPGGSAPLNETFTAAISGGSSTGYAFNWSFGDGGLANGSSAASHVFGTVGTYQVTLNVTDLAGRMLELNSTVTVVPALTSLPTASPSIGSVPQTVDFQAGPSGGEPPVFAHWNFGDGGTASGVNVTHTYTVAGNYTATVALTDAFGDRTGGNVSVTLAPTLLATVSDGPLTGAAPFDANFTERTVGGNPPYAFAWSFGDGSGSDLPDPSHTYTTPGSYTVALAVTDSTGRSTVANTTVTVVPPLSETVDVSPSRGVTPLTVTFTAFPAGGEPPYFVNWTFGDGSSAAGASVSHTFVGPGNYTVTGTVRDSLGLVQSTRAEVLAVSPLKARIAANSSIAEEPSGIAFTASASGGLAPVNWTWTFGDGGVGYGVGPLDHRFAQPGTYAVRLTAQDALGESATATLTVTVRSALTADVSVVSPIAWAGNVTNFTATITGGDGPFLYAWAGTLAGCTGRAAPVLSCVLSQPGTFNVTLTVVDALNRTVVASQSVQVVPAPATGGPVGIGGSWELAVGGVVLIAAIGLAVVIARARHRGASQDGAGPALSEDGESDTVSEGEALDPPAELSDPWGETPSEDSTGR